jgi:glycosyltransferase involved in cell wall biosynthesis
LKISQQQNLPIKVLFFHIMRENFSGAQKNIFRLLINLDKTKVIPILVGQNESPLTKFCYEKDINVKILPYPIELEVFDGNMLKFNLKRMLNFVNGLLKYNKSFVAEFEEFKPDIVWCDNIRTFITLYFPAKKIDAQIIWNIWSEPKGRVAWVLHRIGLIFAHKINLEYSTQGVQIFGILAKNSYFKKKLIPLYTGVSDFEEFFGTNIKDELGLPSDSILIVMASSILPAKGQLDLIKCFSSLSDKFKNIHLLLAGTAVESSPDSKRYFNEIQDYVNLNNLSHHVHFIGWRNDIRDIYKNADIYVSTSYSESFPDAVREAMLASLPVIVTDVGGTRELVNIGENGYLFKPGDVQILKYYLEDLINNKSSRIKMGLVSKEIIDTKFSTKAYAFEFEKMLFQMKNYRNDS